MDELRVLKEFRAGTAPIPARDPARERTMAAIRALIEQEAAARRMPKRTGVSGRRFAAAVAVAAGVAALLSVLPIRQSNRSLVGDALAAIGSGSVLHVVAEQPTGRELLDLASGQATPIMQQEEIWFDDGAGLRRDITSIDGRIVDDTFTSPAGGFTPHGIVYDCTWIAAHPKQATKARVSCNLSGDNGTTPRDVPRPKPTLDPGLLGFVDGYRRALSSGAAHDGGAGTVDGRPVDWLVFTTSDGPERVALDTATHKPILLRGPGAPQQLRITAIETMADAAPGTFVKPSSDETPIVANFGRAADQQKLVDLSPAAISAAYPGTVWAGNEVNGLPLASATVQQLTTSYPGTRPPDSGLGLQLQYGSLTPNGHRDFSKPYATISVAPGPDLAMAYMWGFAGKAILPPAPGQLLTEISTGGPNGLYVGFMSVNGKLVSIQASDEELLLAAARQVEVAR
jgi:hypothetical protein